MGTRPSACRNHRSHTGSWCSSPRVKNIIATCAAHSPYFSTLLQKHATSCTLLSDCEGKCLAVAFSEIEWSFGKFGTVKEGQWRFQS